MNTNRDKKWYENYDTNLALVIYMIALLNLRKELYGDKK